MSTAHASAGGDVVRLDRRGRRLPTQSLPGHRRGVPPRNKGRKYDPEILKVEEIHQLLSTIATPRKFEGIRGELARQRLYALTIVLWRTGIRISEALDLRESDLHPENRSIVIRRGKGGKRRIVMMDAWGWTELEGWLQIRATLPPGALFPVVNGITAGDTWSPYAARDDLRVAGRAAGLRKRCNPHSFRHNFAVEFWLETKNILALQLQLGHANLAVTQHYLRGLITDDILQAVAHRAPPMVPLHVWKLAA